MTDFSRPRKSHAILLVCLGIIVGLFLASPFLLSKHIAPEPTVLRSYLQTDTVKHGLMAVDVKGVGELTKGSHGIVARVTIPDSQSKTILVGQSALVRLPSASGSDGRSVTGHVSHVADSAVDISFDIPVSNPQPARRGVDATIYVEKPHDVLYVERPEGLASSIGTLRVFKVEANDKWCSQVSVKVGRISATSVEVISGLQEGDRIVTSDMSQWNDEDHVRIK